MSLLAEFTEIDVAVHGRVRHFRLHEPAAGEVISLVLDADLRMSDLVQRRLALELYHAVADVDGVEPDWQDVQAWAAEPEILGALLHARTRLYNHLAVEGRALAFCPHCDGPPVELDLLFYWLVLSLPKWEFFDRGVLMHIPSLSSQLPAGSRPPQTALARKLEFTYPEHRGEIHSLASAAAQAREQDYWQRFVPEGVEPPEECAHWRRNSPGFRAILRLAVALTPDPEGREVTPAEVDELPLGAFLFCDLLHFAAVNVDVKDPTRAQVTCKSCGKAFLPVL